ncbi:MULTISPECIES: FadR/GntR family transcriptional regulator [Clostridium]|uniref:FadR family transcriptional regulator n=2 Tax=Clostridium TaxID=1485 RepID=A0ABS7ANE8_9CLOT|nr:MULTISPECIES: FadR/GntR family transcriptional regulator [Clostridium]MBW6410178.1 FadR family transcriptional regulator [Clostridium weizhouense]MDR5588933.1 FadR/GntR family transcriptional regulator [Clostridium sp. 5N-1]
MSINKPIRVSLTKQIADEFENAILRGDWKVGEKIPSEPELCTQFNVSRNTIREALQSLIQASVLSSRQGSGTYVIASSRFEANMKEMLTKSSVNEIAEVRWFLEKQIVRLAAERCNENDIRNMKEALLERNTIKDTVKENSVADLKFHIEITKACHNSIFYDLYKSISKYIQTEIHNKNLKNLDENKIDNFHIELFENISSHNPDKASNTIEKILNL